MSLSSLQESAKKAALAVVEGGPTKLGMLQSALRSNFRDEPLGATQAAYAAGDVTKNDNLFALVAATQDVVDGVLNDLTTLEQYIHLTIPIMEDGNNFGVTVQLAALKQMSDDKEKLEKGLEEMTKYASQRADALEKCKLPSQTTTTSTSTSESNSEGNNTEKGDVTSSEKKTATEEKKTATITDSPELQYRKLAVTAVDVMFYRKAKSLFQLTLTSYMAAIDFLSKNEEKIAAPKGSNGSGSAFSSMY